MLSKSAIYKIVYEYLTVTEGCEGIDKLLNNWIVVDPSKPESNVGTVSLINLCAMLREDMKSESNKSNGKADIEKAMKSVIKSATIRSNPCFHGAFMNNGMQCVCDGYRVIRLYNPIELPAPPTENTMDILTVYNGKSTASEELALPEMSELKALIKIGVAENKAKYGRKANEHCVLYCFGEGKPTVNAEYLADMMTAFPYARAYIEPGSLTKPIFFVSADGDGILLPIKIKQEVD